VRIWPVLLDSDPAYLRHGDGDSSLLLAPLGLGTVIDYIRAAFAAVTPNAPLVLRDGDADAKYVEAVTTAWPSATVAGTTVGRIEAFLPFEPSDALVIVDPRCLPATGLDLSGLVHHFAAEPRVAHHLVAFEAGIAGTKERVSFDSSGKVRGIIRHYEQATWPFISGVAATVLPAACGVLTDGFLPASLNELRHRLTVRGVPGRDLPIDGHALDLGLEADMLSANEQQVLRALDRHVSDGDSGPLLVGEGHSIDANARIVGPVIIQSGARVEKHATILGPAVIAANACIQSRAVVVHSVIGRGCTVQAHQIVRDRACFGQSASHKGGSSVITPASFSERVARIKMNSQKIAEPAPSRRRVWNLRLKRALDIGAAGLALTLLSPLLAVIAILLKLDSKGPLFYGDKREGLRGRAFRCWKFRTMAVGADAVQKDLRALAKIDGPHFKLDHDPRVTRIGRLLRASNVDELPQLINVLVGQMSLVGPRPSPFRENQVCVPWREARLSVTPGITGLWQVCRHDRASGDFHQWIEYDLLYVQHFSFWLDLKIIAATLWTMGGKAGHASPSWMVAIKPAAAVTEISMLEVEPVSEAVAS